MSTPKTEEKQKGMFTVEAVFIVPLMLFCIFGIIYLSILLYQNAVAVTEATRAVNRAAAYWSYIDMQNPPALTEETAAADLITKEMYLGRSPYRFIGEAFMNSGSQRMRNSSQYAQTRVAGIPFRAYSAWNGTDVEVGAEYGFLSSSLQVVVQKKYVNPLGNLLRILRIGSRQEHTATAQAPVTNPTEFIRNVDTLYDVGTGLWSMADENGNGSTQTSVGGNK